MSQQLAVIETVRKTLSNEITAAGIRATLPSTIGYDHFRRVAETAIQTSPDLQACTPASLVAACVKCAEMGLLPDGQEAAIVKFNVKVKKGREEYWEARAQTIPMIAGLRKHVQQSGEVLWWRADVVRQGDVFRHVLGDEPSLVHEPVYDREDGGSWDDAPIRFFYSIAKLQSGELLREVMTAQQVDAIRRRSKSKDHGPWVTDYVEMGKKTVMRRLYKSLPRAKDPAKALFVAKAVRALDEAMEVIEVEHEEAPRLTHQEAAREKLLAAVDGAGEDERPTEPEKRTRRRKTPQERLDEVNAGNAAAQPQPTPASASQPPASGAEIDGEFEAFPGDQPDEEPSKEEQEKAFRRGWHGRFDSRVRPAPMDLKHNSVLVECYESGWDKADEAAMGSTPPTNTAQSEAQLTAIVNRVFA